MKCGFDSIGEKHKSQNSEFFLSLKNFASTKMEWRHFTLFLQINTANNSRYYVGNKYKTEKQKEEN